MANNTRAGCVRKARKPSSSILIYFEFRSKPSLITVICMDPHSPNKLFVTKYCFLIRVSFSISFFSFFFSFLFLFFLLFYVVINFYKNHFIIVIIIFLFFHENFFIFSCSGMFRDFRECSGMFRVPCLIDGRRELTFHHLQGSYALPNNFFLLAKKGHDVISHEIRAL